MSVRVLSQERFIVNYIEEQVRFLTRQEGEPYSWGIEFGIGELVRVQMRQLAQAKNQHESVLLEGSIEVIQEKLNRWCAGERLNFDFTPYFPGVRKGLRFAAREMGELSRQLVLSRQLERVASRERITDGATVPLEIVQIGLQNAIESLLVIPLTEELELNLGRVREEYIVEGQWFPYQIVIEPFSLLLDDDGTILIPALGSSEELIEQARETLLILAVRLYQLPHYTG